MPIRIGSGEGANNFSIGDEYLAAGGGCGTAHRLLLFFVVSDRILSNIIGKKDE